MRIELEDTDGITSVEPIRLVINGIVDQPPVIQTELRGIGSSITRKATIPVSGTITDDYGIAKTEFQFRVDKNKDWRISPFRRPAVGTPKEHLLRREESDNTERFEVLPAGAESGPATDPVRVCSGRRQFERPAHHAQRGIRLSDCE
jgi:hypothetical protein